MLGYGLLGIGALVLVLLGALKVKDVQVDHYKTAAQTAQANEKLAVDANASLKASCDKAIKQFKDAQDAWMKQVETNKKKAAAVKQATKKPDPKAAELEKNLATAAATKEAQCEAATHILHDLAVDSVPNPAAVGK